MQSVQCVVYSVHCTLYRVYCIVYTVHCTLYTVQHTLYQTAEENIRVIMRKWVMITGMPEQIVCDNHPGFSAKFFEAVLKTFDCKVIRSTLYLSRSTGKAERTNRRINSALRAIIPPGKESSWDLY